MEDVPMLGSAFPTGLTAEQAIALSRAQASLLERRISQTSTPNLDRYKTAFILGRLKPTDIHKLRNKLPRYQMGALAALKRAARKQMTLQELLDAWHWKTEMEKKHTKQSSSNP